MSRDITPRELYLMDKEVRMRQGQAIRDAVFYIKSPDGSLTFFESDTTRKLRKQYPELGFLFKGLEKTYELLSEHPRYRKRVLENIEKHLVELEIADCGDRNDIVWLWYTGSLDKNFYYAERNNRLFAEYIINEVNNLVDNGRKQG